MSAETMRHFQLFVLAFFVVFTRQILCPIAEAGQTDSGATFAGPADDQKEYVEGEVLVVMDDDTDQADKAVEALAGGVVKQRISFLSPRQSKRAHQAAVLPCNKRVLCVKLPAGKSVKQAMAEQWGKKDARIVRVEPNYKVRILGVPNDPLFGQLWALRNTGQSGGTANADIDAVSAWDITTGSDSVVVAVVDTGIDYRHPDLAANIWTNTGEIPGNGIDDDKNGFVDDVHGYDFVKNDGDPLDEHSHGSHCAGTIAARGNNGVGVTGINWRCKLMACRFLDEKGSGSVTDAIKAINYAVANGADVLSNSWGGGGYSASLAAAITNALNHGVLFVAAAGNDGADCDASPHYPSGYNIANVIAVAATDRYDGLAGFSNYGASSVHLGAPGVSILSSVLNGQYASYSGTSMATPHVAGVAALLLAYDPAMNIYELKSRLIWTGDPVQSLADKTITGKRLNAYNALTAQPALTVLAPNSQVTWVQGFDWPIRWMSILGNESVDIYLLKPDGSSVQLANGVSNTGTFSWRIPNTIAAGAGYKIRVDDGVNSDQSDANFTISDTPADYFTELFNGTHSFDLSNKSLMLTPDESASRYTVCLKEITELPTDPAGGTNLNLDDDDAELVTLDENSVRLYGTSYNSFYVGSNGFITFGSPDIEFSESISAHFGTKRISGLFRDLDPSSSGSVGVERLDDRVAITWDDVPEYGSRNGNTFQIELFFDGRIRLSWLNVAASSGLAGISEGLGVAVDFLQSNISGYEQCRPTVESVEIIGPDSVEEESSAQFACIARYDDGSIEDVTAEQASWNADSNYAEIDASGRLTTGEVSDFQQCPVSATFSGKSDARTILITDSAVHTFEIQKCKVKAGSPGAPEDSILCSGSFDVTAGLFAAANDVTVQIYSAADDYLVYEQTISPDLFSVSRNVYTYKTRLISGQPGGITLLRFDTNKNTFCLRAQNIDLTGLRCPFYVLIKVGDYTGLGITDEDVVNGKRSIPIQLLSGYTDTLSASKVRLKVSSQSLGDKLSVKGTFTVSDNSTVIQGLTIAWGAQTFTIPGSEFRQIGTNRFKGDYRTIDGAAIHTDFNCSKCTFTIVIKQTTITSKTGTIDFGLTFGNYGKTVKIST